MNSRDAIARLRELGCTIEDVRRTGEVRIHPPDRAMKPITTAHHSRRKSAAQVVVQLVKKLEAAQEKKS